MQDEGVAVSEIDDEELRVPPDAGNSLAEKFSSITFAEELSKAQVDVRYGVTC